MYMIYILWSVSVSVSLSTVFVLSVIWAIVAWIKWMKEGIIIIIIIIIIIA